MEVLIIMLAIFIVACIGVGILSVLKNKKELNFKNILNEYEENFVNILDGVITILSVKKDDYETRELYVIEIVSTAAEEIYESYADVIGEKYKKLFTVDRIEDFLFYLIEKYDTLKDKIDKNDDSANDEF